MSRTTLGSDFYNEVMIASRKDFDKSMLKNGKENKLYMNLRKEFPDNNIYGLTVKEYVEKLKEEIKEEN